MMSERGDVVDDHQREQEHAQSRRAVAADEREDAERERGVGADRDAPALRVGRTAVEREIDERRRDDAADRGDDRRRQTPPLAQLAHVELAPDLEADDEEEERHQAVVDPVAEVQRDADVPEPDRDLASSRTPRTWTTTASCAQTSATAVAVTSTIAPAFCVAKKTRKGVAARLRIV